MANGVGFGGSPRMALLMGLTSGFNKSVEKQREREREDILNQQAQAQIRESEQRVRRSEEITRREQEVAARQAEADAAAAEREAAAAEQEGNRMQAIADLIVAANPDITPEQALALAPNIPADTVNRLLDPGGEDELRPDQAALARLRAADADKQEMENRLNAAVSDLRNSNTGLRIRKALLSGDEPGLEIAITAATGGETPLHSMEAVEAYIAEIQPKDDAGNMKLTDGQKEAARMRGATAAKALIQQQGSLDAAINVMTRQVIYGSSSDPFTAAVQAEMLRALRQQFDAEQNASPVAQELARRLAGEGT